jgi:glucan-binding YG repeat protein
MDLVKNVGDKLDARIKSGDIKQSELYSEATDIMNKMRDMPGMGGIQEMLQKMGLGTAANLGRNAKVDVNATQDRLNRMEKAARLKEKMRHNAEAKHAQKMAEQIAESARAQAQAQAQGQAKTLLSEEELVALFTDDVKPNKKSSKKGSKTKK